MLTGVETTRHFLLEWLSYTYRYIPVGLLDVIPQRLNWRPPSYFGRNDLETLMASDSAADWVNILFSVFVLLLVIPVLSGCKIWVVLLQIRISEMLLGKVPEGFTFAPKHKSNAYDRAENGWLLKKLVLRCFDLMCLYPIWQDWCRTFPWPSPG